MARESIKLPLNLSVLDNKRRLVSQIGILDGWYDVSLMPRRPTRSLRQNAWYFSCIAAALAQYLSDQDYDVTTTDQAHELLKARFLKVAVTNKRTGEVLQNRVRSTTELTTEEFSDYCERCRTWLADFFGIIVPDPDPDHHRGATVRGISSAAPHVKSHVVRGSPATA